MGAPIGCFGMPSLQLAVANIHSWPPSTDVVWWNCWINRTLALLNLAALIRTIMIVPLNADLLAISWLSSSEWMIPNDLTECHNDSPVVRWTFYQFGLLDSNHWTISIGRNEFRVDERLACKWWTNDGKYCLMNGKSTNEPGRRWYSLYNRLCNTECMYCIRLVARMTLIIFSRVCRIAWTVDRFAKLEPPMKILIMRFR